MRTSWSEVARTGAVAVIGVIAVAAVFVAVAVAVSATAEPHAGSSAAATPPAAPAARTCADVRYSDRTQAGDPDGRPNAAGVIFKPDGDVFRIWDNEPDGHLVGVWFNYAGVKDKWKPVESPADGTQRDSVRTVSERYRQICFRVVTHDSQSPIVRYTTRP